MLIMKTKRKFSIEFDCSRSCYSCHAHEQNYLKGELVSEVYHPVYRFDTLADALGYFGSTWNVGYNRINFDNIDNLLKAMC